MVCIQCLPEIVTLLQSKMRIGLAEKTVQMALGQAAVYSDKKSTPPKVQSPFEEVITLFQAFIYLSPIFDLIGLMSRFFQCLHMNSFLFKSVLQLLQ
jgi:hypothetical protein